MAKEDKKINDLAAAVSVVATMQFETDIGGTTANRVTSTQIGTYTNTAQTFSSLNTTNKEIDTAINEVFAGLPNAVEDPLTISSDGQTAFVLSTTPASDAAFKLYINGQLAQRGIDYTRSGTSLTWKNEGSLGSLEVGEFFVAYYNDTAGISATKSHVTKPDSNLNYNNRRVRNIGTTGAYRLNFDVPKDFTGTLTVKVILYPVSGAGGTGKDVDISGEYTLSAGASSTQYTFSDTTSTYDLGTDDTRTEIDITSLLPNLAAGAEGGLLWDNKGIGGGTNIVEIEVINT